MNAKTILFRPQNALLLVAALSLTGNAGEAITGKVDEGSTIIYDQSYFASYKPVTLNDMMRQIPGAISLINDLMLASASNGRGFGSSGAQLLIDGKRVAGKANDINKKLNRIQASQVDHIELIRSTAEGYDIRSDGVLFNVVMVDDATSGPANFVEARLNYASGGKLVPETLLTHNNTVGSLNYGLTYQFDRSTILYEYKENVLAVDRSPMEYHVQERDKSVRNRILTGNMGYQFADESQLVLNALYSHDWSGERGLENRYLTADGEHTFAALENAFWLLSDRKWELGGNYDTNLQRFGTLKTMFVVNQSTNHDEITQDLLTDDTISNYFASIADYVKQEKIVRGSINKPLDEQNRIEYGAEGAFNALKKQLKFNVAADDSAIVKEDRFEIFATHSYKINDTMHLQSSMNIEFSTIFQLRDQETNSRFFQYLKPRIEYRHDLTKQQQLQLVSERTVSQLNLNHFLANRNIEDDTIDFGNPNLVPEKAWRHSIRYEQRLPNDQGAIDMELFYKDISDHIDKIALGPTSSGVGNIGDANQYGADISGNMRLTPINLPDASVTLSYMHIDSHATDPFTGESRSSAHLQKHYWAVDFLHDISGSDLTYGFNVHKTSPKYRQDIILREQISTAFHSTLFVEFRLLSDTKLRLDIQHPFGDRRKHSKTFYASAAGNDIIDRIELRDYKKKTDFLLTLQSTF